MTDPRRITGFMPLAKEIVEAQPGLTAKEIFSLAQQRSVHVGIPISASANPEASLVATLQKVYKDYDLERRGGRDGRYRFYLKGQGAKENLGPFGSLAKPISPDGSELAEGPSVHGSTTSLLTDPPGDSGNQRTLLENPSDFPPPSFQPPTKEEYLVNGRCCIESSSHQASKIRALVDLGLYPSEHDAHGDLVKKGLESILAKLSI